MWLRPGARFGVDNLPANFGQVSCVAAVGEDGTATLEYSGPKNYRCTFAVEE
jgi:hypothetical protein